MDCAVLFGRASRTRRERSIRPKISRIDFDLTELESSEVWWGPPKPVVGIQAPPRPAPEAVDAAWAAAVVFAALVAGSVETNHWFGWS